MKYLFITLLICLIQQSVFSQEQKNYYSDDKINLSYRYHNCNDAENGIFKEYAFFTITNKTEESIRVSYKKELWYNNKCTTCNVEGKEHNYSIVLNPKESKTGSCATKEKSLAIFSKMLNMKKSELSKFELTNISTTIIK